MSTRILLVDDSPVFARGLKALLSQTEEFHLIGVVSTASEAEARIGQANPDIVLVDLRIARHRQQASPSPEEGIALMQRIKARWPHVTVLVISFINETYWMAEAFHAGASGFLNKDDDETRILDSLRAAARKEVLLTESQLQAVMTKNRRPSPLTPREQEVLRLLAQNKTNAAIARELGISSGTVRTHVGNIMNKLGVHDRKDAVAEARRRGWL